MTSTTNAPAPIAQAKKKVALTIREQLEGDTYKAALAAVLPKHLTAERFVRIAVQAMTRNPDLYECERNSFFVALSQLSQWGLEPDGRRAHLIPFKNRRAGITECQVIIDYKGLVELVMNTGVVSFLHADVVCENDEFDFNRGELLVHRVDYRKPRGNVFAVYALCRFKDRSEHVVVMSKEEVELIRSRSRSRESGPWVTDWNEMAKKTVFRRLSKWLPLSGTIRDAVEKDDEELEERRFAAARPVFDSTQMLAGGPTPALPPPDSTRERDNTSEEVDPDPLPAEVSTPTPSNDAAAKSGPPALTPLQAEVEAMLTEAGISWGLLQAWARETHWEPGCDSWGTLHDLPDASARRLLQAKSGLIAALNREKEKVVPAPESRIEKPA